MSESCEINGVEVNAIFRISEEHHLLPLDLPKSVVLDERLRAGDLDRRPGRQLCKANPQPSWPDSLTGYVSGRAICFHPLSILGSFSVFMLTSACLGIPGLS